MSAGGAAGRVAPGVVSALRNRFRPDISPTALDSAQALLAERVHKVEARQLAELGVGYNHGIPVQLGSRGSLRDIVEIYDSCSGGRLVLTGAPGAGKTVAVLHLLLGLLDNWKRRGTDWQPVPVRVNAASWDGGISVLDFLAIRVAEVYRHSVASQPGPRHHSPILRSGRSRHLHDKVAGVSKGARRDPGLLRVA